MFLAYLVLLLLVPVDATVRPGTVIRKTFEKPSMRIKVTAGAIVRRVGNSSGIREPIALDMMLANGWSEASVRGELYGETDEILMQVASNPTSESKSAKETCIPKAACLTSVGGRLGNNLWALETTLEIAKISNLCFVKKLPQPKGRCHHGRPCGWVPLDFINIPQEGFRASTDAPAVPKNLECSENVWGRKAWLLPTVPGSKVETKREMMLKFIVDAGMLKCKAHLTPQMNDVTLTMHMRSGDIADSHKKEGLIGWYPQPPCAYYQKAFETGNDGHSFKRGLILTEPDKTNPCIPFMQSKYPGLIEVVSRSFEEDACTMLLAKNLAVTFGTWGPTLSRLNKPLKNLFVPWGLDGVTEDEYGGNLNGSPDKPRDWFHWVISEDPLNYTQHVFSFPKFTSYDTGFSNPKMLRYSSQQIIHRIIPPKQTAPAGGQ